MSSSTMQKLKSICTVRQAARIMRSNATIFLILFFILPSSQISSAQDHETGLQFIDENDYRSIPLASTPLMGGIPTSSDMSASFPPPGSQGHQGSCVGWAVSYLKAYQEQIERQWKVTVDDKKFSPSFIYNQIKLSNDCVIGGAHIEDALNLVRSGAASLDDFPYDETTCHSLPDGEVKFRSRQFAIADWRRVNAQDVVEVKTQLSAGFPVVIGAVVDDAFQNLKAGETYSSPDGMHPSGHAMVVVGYNDDFSAFKVINSWGQKWADNGFGWISYATFSQMTRRAYVAQDIIIRPPPPPFVNNIRVLYFKKEADQGKVDEALQRLNIQYEPGQATSQVPTSLLTCTPDIPGEKLRAIALSLYDSGVRLKRVNFALRSLNVRNRISLESTSRSNDLHALTRDDLQRLDKCQFLKSDLDEE